ncbi:MAG: translocation/assembly module TamB domain-containing protein [Reyranellaceae bacterium]
MRALRLLGIALAGVVALLALAVGLVQTPLAKRLIADAVSGKDLRIAGISGFVPTDLAVETIELRDAQGIWLRLENAAVRWSFGSLFSGRVRIERLAAALVDVQREPVSDGAAPAASGGGGFSLPVGVDLQDLSVVTLHLGAALAGIDSRWCLQGSGLLSADLREGKLKLDGDRTDGPAGKLAADLRFDVVRRFVDGTVAVDEGKGGLVAGLLERPDLESVAARLTAKGDQSTGAAEIDVAAGDAATAKGNVRWQPAGAATAVSLDLQAGGTVLARWGGPVAVTGAATVDAATVVLSSLTLSATPASLSASGRWDRKADHLDLEATARAPAPGPLAPLLPGIDWRDLELAAQARVDGLLAKPRGMAHVTAKAQSLSVAAVQDRLPALGPVTVDGDVGLAADGTIAVQRLDVATALASVKVMDGSFVPATEVAAAKVAIDVPSLAPLSTLAQRDLVGRARIDLDLRNDPKGLSLGWQGKLEHVGAPGVPAGLVAREVTLSGRGTLGADERWSVVDAKVQSEAGSFGFSGEGQGAAGRLDLAVDLRDLASVRAGLNGNVGARARIELAADGAVAGSVNAQGTTENQPLSLDGRFARDAAGGITVPQLAFHWASAALDVADLAITPQRTTGQATLKVARLQEIGTLVGTPLAGSLDAAVVTDPQLADKRLQVRIAGKDLARGTQGVASLQIEGTVDDPLGNAGADLRLAAAGLRGVADLSRADATVKGDRAGGFDVTLKASGGQTAADLAARIELAGQEIRVALARFAGRGQGIPVSLAAPTRIVVAGPRVQIQPTSLSVGGGRLTMQGVVDPQASDLRLELTALPLSLVDTFAPGTGLEGTAQARATVTGAIAAPRVDATYGASGVRVRRPETALLPALSLQGTAGLAGGQATFDARVGAGAGTNLALAGRMAVAPLAGRATVTGNLDLAPFAPLLGNQIRNVSGSLRSNLAIEIAGGRITGSGGLDLDKAALGLPEAGLRLTDGSGRIALQGESVVLQNIAFRTAGGGTVTAQGTVRLVPEQGAALDLSLASRRALLVSRPDLAATVSSDLRIVGTTARGLDVSGPLTIDRAEINLAAPQMASFPTLEVREINAPGAAAAPPPPAAAPPGPAVGAAAAEPSGGMPIRLALTIQAPQAVFVRGRGLDAEMGGSLQVAGTPAAPAVTGGLSLRRGTLNLLGRNLVFSRGVVTLDNLEQINPRLDFLATANVNSISIQVAIKGTARVPTFAITSTPQLPQDEALALLLFGKPSSSLSAFELIQVAQGLAELTGQTGPAGSVLGKLRQGLGLDQLKLGSSSSSGSSRSSGSGASGATGMSIEAGRYVAPGVYVGARQGATGNSSRGVVEIEVLPNTKIEGDIGADSNGRVGAKMEWDY